MGYLLCVLSGFAGGAVTGFALVAFIMVLGLVSRMVDIAGYKADSRIIIPVILSGVLVGNMISLFPISLRLPAVSVLLPGFIFGIFIGMITSALTEVLNVYPYLFSRMGLKKWIFLMPVVFLIGKVTGSLVYFIVPGFY